MPKQKTHKATAKRFRLTKRGKLMRLRTGRSHLRRKKSQSTISDYRHTVPSTEKSTIKMVKQVAGQAVKN
jgi:large subunit ribosomal protein L35